MSVKFKFCANCGKKINVVSSKCPYCNSTVFKDDMSVQTSDSNQKKFVYDLFYWKDSAGNVSFSRTRFFSVLIAVYSIISSPSIWDISLGFILALITAIPVFLIGFVIHSLRNTQTVYVDKSNADLGEDIKHLLFYWHKGDFVLSKTKIITVFIFVFFFFLFQVTTGEFNLLGGAVAGLLFAVPAFLIGFAIHKATDDEKVPEAVPSADKIEPAPVVVEEIPEVHVNPKLNSYRMEVTELKNSYDNKEKTVKKLIEKYFSPPQLAYIRFTSAVDNCTKIFNKQAEIALTIIDLDADDTPKIVEEIESKIKVLNSIIEQIDLLSDELVLSIGNSKSQDEDVKNLIEDMENLIDSIDDYV